MRYTLRSHVQRIFLALMYIGLASGLIAGVGYLASIMPNMVIPFDKEIKTYTFINEFTYVRVNELGNPSMIEKIEIIAESDDKYDAFDFENEIPLVVGIGYNGSWVGYCGDPHDLVSERCFEHAFIVLNSTVINITWLSDGRVYVNDTLALEPDGTPVDIDISRNPGFWIVDIDKATIYVHEIVGIDLRVIVTIAVALFPILLLFKAVRLMGVTV